MKAKTRSPLNLSFDSGDQSVAYLIVILESLREIVLYVEGSGQLVTTFSSHRLVLSVVEGVQGQMLHFRVVLLEKEVVGQMIQHHRVGGVDGVSLGQLSNALLDGGGFLGVEVEYGLAD